MGGTFGMEGAAPIVLLYICVIIIGIIKRGHHKSIYERNGRRCYTGGDDHNSYLVMKGLKRAVQ